MQTKPPVRLHEPAQVTPSVTLRISSVKAVRAQARLPGEVSGPGVLVAVVVTNHSGRGVRVGDAVVTMIDSAHAPSGMITDSRARPLSGVLAAGRTRTGTYVFTVPTSRRSPVTVSVTLTGDSPVVTFVGTVS